MPDDWRPPVSYSIPELVTVSSLISAFGLSDATVRNRLRTAGVKPVRRERDTGQLFPFRQAANALAEPVLDVEQFIRLSGPEALPTKMQNAYWTAQNRRLEFETRAGKLWHTEDVFTTLQDIAVLIQTHITQWPDQVQQQSGVTDEERKLREAQVDLLLTELRTEIAERVKSIKTKNVRGQFEDRTQEEEAEIDEDDTERLSLMERFV